MTDKMIKRDDISERLDLEGQLMHADSSLAMLGDLPTVIKDSDIKITRYAREVLKTALAEAKQVKSIALAELKAVQNHIEAEKQRGYAEGKALAQDEILKQITQIKVEQQQRFDQFAMNVVDLVAEISERIIGDLLQTDVNAMLGLIRQAAQASLGNELVVCLNPADYDQVKASEPRLLQMLQAVQSIRIKSTDAVKQGTCLVQSELGSIEADPHYQIQVIKQALQLAMTEST